jgi:hypothetical protein
VKAKGEEGRGDTATLRRGEKVETRGEKERQALVNDSSLAASPCLRVSASRVSLVAGGFYNFRVLQKGIVGGAHTPCCFARFVLREASYED